jgi:hypothetical protein
MDLTALFDLVTEYREDALRLRPLGAPGAAAALEEAAERLEARLADWLDAPLTPQQAAAETGLKRETVAKRIASGELPNAGRKYRPRVRRRDLFDTRVEPRVTLPTPVERLLEEI